MKAKKTIKVNQGVQLASELEDTKLLAKLSSNAASDFLDATEGADKRDRMLLAMEFIAILRHTLHETIGNL